MDKFKPDEAALIKEKPQAGIPQIGTVGDPSKVEGIPYEVVFHIGMVAKGFEFKVSTDMSAVMAALFLAIRHYPRVHTVTITDKTDGRLVCYAPLMGIEKTISPDLMVVNEGAAIASSALPAGKNFADLQKEIKLRDQGARR